MGDMTDFDKILPHTDGKVNGKCPIKRTERRSSWYKHPRGPAVPSADTRLGIIGGTAHVAAIGCLVNSEAVSARNQPQGEGKGFPARTYPAQNVLQH